VSRALGWKVLRSDDVRRAIPRIEEEEEEGRYGLGRYAPKATAAVYSELLTRAEGLLTSGESVVLDASWIDGSWRAAAQRVASQTGGDLVELCCRVRSDIADTRITQRLFANSDVSEATPQVRLAMQEAMDPWPTSSEIDTTDSTVEESIAQALCVVGIGD
jgi:predicted kinase